MGKKSLSHTPNDLKPVFYNSQQVSQLHFSQQLSRLHFHSSYPTSMFVGLTEIKFYRIALVNWSSKLTLKHTRKRGRELSRSKWCNTMNSQKGIA